MAVKRASGSADEMVDWMGKQWAERTERQMVDKTVAMKGVLRADLRAPLLASRLVVMKAKMRVAG